MLEFLRKNKNITWDHHGEMSYNDEKLLNSSIVTLAGDVTRKACNHISDAKTVDFFMSAKVILSTP